ncbi:hypothetical protein [Flyfo microvirus Tbat2_185]|nr:hypothetical protein [Flyfo microvirus Tbat2_185]
MKFITQRTYKPGADYEKITEKSMTKPDMSMTVEQLYTRYRNGQALDQYHDGYYLSETQDVAFEDSFPMDIDLVDIDEARMATADIKGKLGHNKQAQKEAKTEPKKPETEGDTKTPLNDS